MAKFNRKTAITKTVNIAGGSAFKHGSEMELVTAVLSTFLENKAYESGDERSARIAGLCKQVSPDFIGKLAVVARNDFHMRSVSHLLVGELARIHRGDSLVSQVISLVAIRPDDLTEIVSYIGLPLPKQVKRGIRHALLTYSPYQLAKYRMDGKGTKLVDLFNLAHPNPKFASKDQKKAWKDLLSGNLKNEETWEARLSSGEDKEEVWEDMVVNKKIGYMALLRNLRNIENQGNKKTIKAAAVTISNRNEVKHSRQLPFRFYKAYENTSDRTLLNAISDAMEYALDNVPTFPGTTLVAVDGSGSMSGDPIQKASLFAAALVKSNDADLILYDDTVQEVRVLTKSPVLTIAETIQQNAHACGTNTSLVFEYAMEKKKEYDRIIILSDNESWADYDSPNSAYGRLNASVEKKPFVYAIDIQGYGTKDLTGSRVRHLCGWSDSLFDFMQWAEKENAIIDFIKNVDLNAKGKK